MMSLLNYRIYGVSGTRKQGSVHSRLDYEGTRLKFCTELQTTDGSNHVYFGG